VPICCVPRARRLRKGYAERGAKHPSEARRKARPPWENGTSIGDHMLYIAYSLDSIFI
jgi:hypothetical protein